MHSFETQLLDLLSDESFQKWLSGKTTESENKKWQQWLNESSLNRQLFNEAQHLWKIAQFQNSKLPDVKNELHKLLEKINKPYVYSIEEYRKREHKRKTSWSRWGIFVAAASIIFAILLQFNFHTKSHRKILYHEVSTDYGQRVKITLPEGSQIILNANSTLKYPGDWSEVSEKHFELKGEAYFLVTKKVQPENKFIITTVDGNIQVVGTRFVVYERGQGTRVVVEEGKVAVAPSDTVSLEKQARRMVLTPGHLIEFRKGSEQLKVRRVDILPYITWWKDKLILNETPFQEIIKRLEETYGVKIVVKNKTLLKRTLSGSIENRNLEVITEALAKALRIPFKRRGQIIIFGK